MKRLDSKGMTLVEVIIAIVIFSIAAIIMLNGILFMLKLNRDTKEMIETTSELNKAIDGKSGGGSADKVKITFNGVDYDITGAFVKTDDEINEGSRIKFEVNIEKE